MPATSATSPQSSAKADAPSFVPRPTTCAAISDRLANVASRPHRWPLRPLYRFLYAEGHRADAPSAVIEGPKRGRALPKVLTIAEVDRLLAQARSDMDKADQPVIKRLRAARLACLIEVLYATGLRVSE